MRNERNSCLFGEELVSYIYNELPAAERHSFEDHLLDCSSCTSEFAGLSMSRLGVYEWHRDEFVPLETPRFAIPYSSPEKHVSWLDAIRGIILTPARLSFAGGALALLVVGLGVFYIARPGQENIAEIQVEQPTSVEQVASDTVKAEDEGAVDKYLITKDVSEPRDRSQKAAPAAENRPLVIQAKSVKSPANRQLTARGTRSIKAPRLGTFEEVEDTSLRLADLVADIDSFRK